MDGNRQASPLALSWIDSTIILAERLTLPAQTVAVAAGTLFFLISFGIGFALGGPNADARKVLALGTTQRSVSIAFLVAIENFCESNVLNVLAILAVLSLVTQIPVALALGTRMKHQKVNST